MAALSVTTVVLSMSDGCPGLAFFILEIVINTSMILEVGIRFVAFGRVRQPLSPCAKERPTLPCHLAILEVAIQRDGPHAYDAVCAYAARHRVRRMWFDK